MMCSLNTESYWGVVWLVKRGGNLRDLKHVLVHLKVTKNVSNVLGLCPLPVLKQTL